MMVLAFGTIGVKFSSCWRTHIFFYFVLVPLVLNILVYVSKYVSKNFERI
jgi:hypothetical protein